MKNKEIEELLNELKDEDNYVEEYGFRYKRIALDDWWLLLSYIEQLEKKVDQYENPDDLTLFYMWLDTKAKDKMKQLENNRDKAIEVIDLITPELWNISNKMTYRLKDIKYILKGDSK